MNKEQLLHQIEEIWKQDAIMRIQQPNIEKIDWKIQDIPYMETVELWHSIDESRKGQLNAIGKDRYFCCYQKDFGVGSRIYFYSIPVVGGAEGEGICQ